MRNQHVKLFHSFWRVSPASHAQSSRPLGCRAFPHTTSRLRAISIQATPSSTSPSLDTPEIAVGDLSPPASGEDAPDARFEVLGSSSSLLSVGLSASQTFFTRRGTLVGVSGSPEEATSTLSPLSPLLRAAVGLPFLYHKVSSPTPLNVLVATKSPHTSFSIIHLDGRLDWTVAQRTGILAWTGHSLSVKPTVNYSMTLAYWGNSVVSGRGLVALAASGSTYQVTLKPGEQYIAHPSNVLAYSMTSSPPQPYRFKSSTLRLQVPSIRRWLPDSDLFRNIRASSVYKFLANMLFTIRTWSRRTIWADRLFLQFQGPSVILLQSRGSRIRDVLTSRDVNEIADAPAGVVSPAAPQPAPGGNSIPPESSAQPPAVQSQHTTPTKTSYATVGKDGHVSFSQSRE